MYHANDAKIHKWIREHPSDPSKVGKSLELTPSPAGASSSTAPAPARSSPGSSPSGHVDPPPAPGDMHVFEDAHEEDFTSVVSMLVAHGVQAIDAQRLVNCPCEGLFSQ